MTETELNQNLDLHLVNNPNNNQITLIDIYNQYRERSELA